jgi:hypothetical protein
VPKPATQQAKKEKMTLIELLRSLDAVNAGIVLDVGKEVQERGVTFEVYPELEKVLRNDFKATDKLLELLPKPDPIPVPPPPAANLHITCKPADCEIFVGAFSGRTDKGERTISELKPGPTEVVVFADGYVKKSQPVTLTANETTQQIFQLQPDEAQRRKQVQQTFVSILNALGGDLSTVEEIQKLTENGNVELKGKGLTAGKWDYSIESGNSSKTFVMTSAAGQYCTASLLGGTGTPSCNKKARFDAETATAADLFGRTSIARILSNFIDGELSVKQEEGGYILESKGVSDRYTLKVDSSYLPVHAATQSTSAPEVIDEVEFSNYTKFKKLQYAQKIRVSRTSGSAAEAQFVVNLSAPPIKGHRK